MLVAILIEAVKVMTLQKTSIHLNDSVVMPFILPITNAIWNCTRLSTVDMLLWWTVIKRPTKNWLKNFSLKRANIAKDKNMIWWAMRKSFDLEMTVATELVSKLQYNSGPFSCDVLKIESYIYFNKNKYNFRKKFYSSIFLGGWELIWRQVGSMLNLNAQCWSIWLKARPLRHGWRGCHRCRW